MDTTPVLTMEDVGKKYDALSTERAQLTERLDEIDGELRTLLTKFDEQRQNLNRLLGITEVPPPPRRTSRGRSETPAEYQRLGADAFARIPLEGSEGILTSALITALNLTQPADKTALRRCLERFRENGELTSKAAGASGRSGVYWFRVVKPATEPEKTPETGTPPAETPATATSATPPATTTPPALAAATSAPRNRAKLGANART